MYVTVVLNPDCVENHSNIFYNRDYKCCRKEGKVKADLRNPSQGTSEE